MGDTVYTEKDLTPGEILVMEVLAARWRLGEELWTFDARNARWVESLAAKGLVTSMHGAVEKTVRASLTNEGRYYYWEDNVPDCGETNSKASDTYTDLVPKKWIYSKKKAKRRLAERAHPNLKK